MCLLSNTSTHNYIIVKVSIDPLLPCLYSYTVCLFSCSIVILYQCKTPECGSIVESGLPLGSSAEGAPTNGCWTHIDGISLCFCNYGMPILHRHSGGCRYCHTAPWKRAMRRLAHGLTRSRGARGLACDVTWPDVRLHPIRLNRAFRSDLMWWRTFVEDWNGISFLPPPTGFRRIGVMGLARLQLVSAPVGREISRSPHHGQSIYLGE